MSTNENTPDGVGANKTKMIPCAHCDEGAEDRPIYTEAVCWKCWARLYGDSSHGNRQGLRAYRAGERAATQRIRSNLQALGFRHEPTGDWIRRDEVLAYLEGEASA